VFASVMLAIIGRFNLIDGIAEVAHPPKAHAHSTAPPQANDQEERS
jgi:hypothetical protein